MPIDLPRIAGTAHDRALNEFIDFINRKGDLKFAAHAVAAIGRFLIEHHEVRAGTEWIRRAMPQVEDVKVLEPMVDKLHAGLVERTQQRERRGCGMVTLLIVVGVLGIAWYWAG